MAKLVDILCDDFGHPFENQPETELEQLRAALAKSIERETEIERQLAESQRRVRVLRDACQTFVEWLEREDKGYCAAGGERETVEGEAKWQKWYEENLRLCGLSMTKAREALASTQPESL